MQRQRKMFMWIANRKECHRIEKLTELLEVTPEILVDDDEVSEIENQRLEMSAPTI